MNIPTIDSTPGRSAGRPETVRPKTTSASPLWRPRRRAQAPCTTVLRVTWWRRERSPRAAVASAESST